MDLIRREDHGATARLTLQDDARLNALSDEMIAALHGALSEIAASGATRAVVIAAEGRAFCAGHDLKQMQAMRQAEDGGTAALKGLFARCSALMRLIPAMPQPVIAEVRGTAVAAGCQLVAASDMAVAGTGARFGVNGVNLGLFCSTPMVALSRAVPRKAAFEMLTTGRLIGAEEAQRIGLVNRVVPAEALTAETMALAGTVAAKLAAAVRLGKPAFYRQAEMGLAEAYDYAGEVMALNLADEDTAEGIQAFTEKRAPRWAP